MKVFYNQEIIEVDSLNSYVIGTSFEDSNMIVLLSDEQLHFLNENPTATAQEVIALKIRDYQDVIAEITDLDHAKEVLIDALYAYDTSVAVNSFTIGGIPMWLPRELRISVKASVEAAKLAKRENHTLWFDDVPFTMPIDLFIAILAKLEVYAADSFNATAQHKVNILALPGIEAVQAYDFTQGYPIKLIF